MHMKSKRCSDCLLLSTAALSAASWSIRTNRRLLTRRKPSLLQQAANDVAQGIVLLRARIARLGAEEALKRTEAELTRVARVTTMGELTASIAHEINQPLAALVTNANACLRWRAAEPSNLDEARTTAQRIVRDGKRASEVIARIRALLAKVSRCGSD